MLSSGILHYVALVRTDVSEEHSASIIRVTRISELGATLALTSNRHTAKKYYVRMEALVWDTRLRMQRGVGVAGYGMGLLNCQTTKRDSIASVEGVGVELFTKQGLRIQNCFAKCMWVMSRKF
jgi:hypothetical protein